MLGRGFNGEKYRFGFNTQEKVTELGGDIYTAEFWMYNAQLGRRWNVDPVTIAWESPYACFGNNPIVFNDPLGNTAGDPQKHTVKKGDTYWDLAKNSNGAYSVDDLKRWNPGVNPTKLKVGQKLNLFGEDVAANNSADNPVNKQGFDMVKTTQMQMIKQSSNATAGAIPIGIVTSTADGPLPFGEVVGGVIILGAVIYDAVKSTDVAVAVTVTTPKPQPILFVTYTKYNPVTGETYVGRASGFGTPQRIVSTRDRVHHKTVQGFGPAIVDRFSVNKIAVRGREQQMIDAYGGAWSTVGRGNTRSGNAINGISLFNPFRSAYLGAATLEFGPPLGK
jgi:hypothetical protein